MLWLFYIGWHGGVGDKRRCSTWKTTPFVLWGLFGPRGVVVLLMWMRHLCMNWKLLPLLSAFFFFFYKINSFHFGYIQFNNLTTLTQSPRGFHESWQDSYTTPINLSINHHSFRLNIFDLWWHLKKLKDITPEDLYITINKRFRYLQPNHIGW